GHDLRAERVRVRHRHGHAAVLEGPGGVHAEMLRLQIFESRPCRASRRVVERRIALAQRHGRAASLTTPNRLAEAPNTALILEQMAQPSVPPLLLPIGWRAREPICRPRQFQQLAAAGAAPIGRLGRAYGGAARATKARAGKLLQGP